MLINRKELEQIAVLAKLSINESEIEAITESLGSVVTMINHINDVETDKVKPMANPLDAVQRLRVDAVSETSKKDQLLSMASNADDDYFLVPTVVE
jgi:aspartyl-tRNA(Asn)/glutamyl-tRNA(Gln) amidotransferase subunit C